MMFRVAVCDNDPSDLAQLEAGTRAFFAAHPQLCGTAVVFRTGAELAEALHRGEQFAVYMLDILMPDVDGLTLARTVRAQSWDAPIVFVTSSPEFALDAYGLHALRYITKPLRTDELISALELCCTVSAGRSGRVTTIKNGGQLTRLRLDDIMYIENNVRSAVYHLADGSTATGMRRSGAFEQSIGSIPDEPDFIQPHKSFFVNMAFIRTLHADLIVMDDGAEIPINRKRLALIRQRYMDFLSDKGGAV